MGYACPVCKDPQADAGHLANHLAFTAMLGDDAHEEWLDENAPGWGQMGEAELADALGESAEETEFPQVFEDTVGGLAASDESPADRPGALFDDASADDDRGHDPGHRHRHGRTGGGEAPAVSGVDAGGPTDAETEAILEEAREMTRAMLGGDGEDTGDAPRAGDECGHGADAESSSDAEGTGASDGAGDGTDPDREDAGATGTADGNENE